VSDGMGIERAPWSDAFVAALAEYQAIGVFHPYTCGNDSSHPPLVPTRDGWRCEACDYRQDWAHSFHARSVRDVTS
jgi:hypothetical protein